MIHPKSALIERSKQLGFDKPHFETKRTGPQHEPTFISDAILNGEVYGTGQGGTKRDAERHASEEALALLEQQKQPSDTPTPDATNEVTNSTTSSDSQSTNSQSNQDSNNRDSNNRDTNHHTNSSITIPHATHYIDSNAQPVDAPFEGPWPLVPDVLATSLHIANSRVNPGAQGHNAIREVHALAVELYKASLQSLGEVIELED